MSVEAKTAMIKQMYRDLGDVLTMNQANNVIEILNNILIDYEVETIRIQEVGSDELLQAYIAAKQVEGRSEKTIERYRYTIQRMMDRLNVQTQKITVYHLRQYLGDEKKRGTVDTTLEGLRQIFAAYFGWLKRENLIKEDPTSNLGKIKCAKRLKKAYSAVDVDKLKKGAKTKRDLAIIEFLEATGCRISEMTTLDRAAVEFDKQEVHVIGKGDKERIVYLNDLAAETLKEYLEERDDDNPALFIGRKGIRLKPGGVRAMLKKIAMDVRVTDVHPHRFRRTLATNLSRRGMPIQEVAAVLGHEKLDTTMKYVVVNQADIKHDYRKFTV